MNTHAITRVIDTTCSYPYMGLLLFMMVFLLLFILRFLFDTYGNIVIWVFCIAGCVVGVMWPDKEEDENPLL